MIGLRPRAFACGACPSARNGTSVPDGVSCVLPVSFGPGCVAATFGTGAPTGALTCGAAFTAPSLAGVGVATGKRIGDIGSTGVATRRARALGGGGGFGGAPPSFPRAGASTSALGVYGGGVVGATASSSA